MRLLGIDFETTGLDTANDRIAEIGLCLWEVETRRPIVTVGVFLNDKDLMEKASRPSTQEMMKRVSGITPEMLTEFGTDAKANLEWLATFAGNHAVDYLCAHNGTNFDQPILMAEMERHGVDSTKIKSIPWIDTRTDIPFATEPDSRKLTHLAAEHGFVNPFAHRAVFDVLTMLRILSNYDLQKVLEYQKIPFVLMRAVVSYDNRQLAKDMRYSWEKIGTETYPKLWVKKVKQNLVEKELADCQKKGFQAVVLEAG